MGPTPHLGINERATGTRANAGDVRVMVNEARRIDVVECAFDQILRPNADTIGQLFRMMFEGAADKVNQTHKESFEFRVSSFEFGAPRQLLGNNNAQSGRVVLPPAG